MVWLVLLALLVAEFLLALLLVKFTAHLPGRWSRWIAFAVSCLIIGGLAAVAIFAAIASIEHYFFTWTDAFSARPPFPTARLFLFTVVPALPFFYFVTGVAGLRRTGSAEPLPRARNWSLRGSLLRFGITCAATLGLFLISDWLILRRIKRYEAEAAQIASGVIPPAIDDEAANAAPLYLASMKKGEPLPRHPGDKKFPRDLNVLLNPAWSEYLEQHQDVAEHIRFATRRPDCRFDLSWPGSSIHNDQSKSQSHLWSGARLLLAEGHAALLKGDADLGYENAIALRAFADHLSRDPRPQSQLTGGTASGYAKSLLEHAFYVRHPRVDELQRLQAQQLEFRERRIQAFRWSQAECYSVLPRMYIEPLSEQRPVAPPPGYSQVLAANLALSRFLFAQDDLTALPVLFEKFRDQTAASYKEGAALDDSPHSHFPDFGWQFCESGGIVTRNLMVMERLVLFACFEADTDQRLADAAIQLAARNGKRALDAGHLDKLEGTADLPIDPFSARPLKVLSKEGGIVVYSFGINQRDNDGEEEKPIRFNADDDETFCFGEAFKQRRLTPPDEQNLP